MLIPLLMNDGMFGSEELGAAEAVKTGTGGIDPKRKRLHLPYKPTGLINRPVKTPVEIRVEETRQIHEEVSQRVFREFLPEETEVEEPEEFAPIEQMSLVQIEAEIGVLLRKKIMNDDEEFILLLLIAASV